MVMLETTMWRLDANNVQSGWHISLLHQMTRFEYLLHLYHWIGRFTNWSIEAVVLAAARSMPVVMVL